MAEISANDTKTKLEIMTRFDEDALKFDFERTAAGYRLRHRLVENLFIRKYRLGAVALDIGCGTGEYALSLARAGFEVVGGDLSKGMLSVAKSKIKRHKLSTLLISTKSLSESGTQSNNAMQVIMSKNTFWNGSLVDSNRMSWIFCVKHQAKLVVCVDALWSPYRIYRKIQLAVSRCGKRYARIFNARELQRVFTKSGFAVEKFFGDVLLAQVITRSLFDPKAIVLADTVLEATQPIDRHLTNLPYLKSLSAHYIIEARKK